jgi:hypothetical protein
MAMRPQVPFECACLPALVAIVRKPITIAVYSPSVRFLHNTCSLSLHGAELTWPQSGGQNRQLDSNEAFICLRFLRTFGNAHACNLLLVRKEMQELAIANGAAQVLTILALRILRFVFFFALAAVCFAMALSW